MSIDNTIEVLDFLQQQNMRKLKTSYMSDKEYLVEEHSPYNSVNFVIGNIRVYIDLEHTRSVLIERKVSLLRTKQQGYVPLKYFPTEVKTSNDEREIIKICSRILELERTAMKKLMNTEFMTYSDMGRVFINNDIIIGDSKHASNGIYVPYVDEDSIVINEEIVNPKVKKLIKDYYIDKM